MYISGSHSGCTDDHISKAEFGNKSGNGLTRHPDSLSGVCSDLKRSKGGGGHNLPVFQAANVYITLDTVRHIFGSSESCENRAREP